eukprot:TRINITY_DN1695_c0_g1_i2.p1 TRINITY_DN1695_c0_g1~~TRINITY_DN1695_c0_g1_i2.p1  ORF type:complete len:697 (-),score=151.06 TRINITY_DN1695_c0_g1_i2:681-2771(-)
MKRQYVDDVVSLLPETDLIRNIAVIAHVDHGKTTLVDSLLSKAGLLRNDDAGSRRLLDTGEEQERQITMKSTGISLIFKGAKDEKKYLVNLVDSPGHVDFSSEVTAALRITDGAMVVVDCVSGVSVQTNTVTRQALNERIKPVLHINKVDRAIQELGLNAEELYQKLNSTVVSMNAVIATYQNDEILGDITLDPRKGNVSFGSGKQGWALRLDTFAEAISARTGKPASKILNRLWGDFFYDPDTRRYVKTPISKSGKPLERYVNQMVLEPLLQVFGKLKNDDRAEIKEMATTLKIKLSDEDLDLPIKELTNRVLQRWLPAGDALSQMIIEHLPSPLVAQKYRVENLYTGPLDDPTATAIRNCDPDGPLSMFVSKMVAAEDGKRFFAFGRVFSGTIRGGQTVTVLGSNYVFGEKNEMTSVKIPRVSLMMGAHVEGVESVPCGCTVGVAGVDTALVKSGCLVTDPEAHPIAPMRFSVSPVVRQAVSPKNPSQLPKFLVGLRRLHKAEQGLEVIINERTSEYIIAGSGELHVEVALNALRELLGSDIAFNVGKPVVEFRETITQPSSEICLGKSSNKHNRVYFSAEPLDEDIVKGLAGITDVPTDPKKRYKMLTELGLPAADARKAWFVEGTNLLVDRSKAVPFLTEIRDHIEVAFREVSRAGALSGEPLQGVVFYLHDAKVHSDSPHRGGAQVRYFSY